MNHGDHQNNKNVTQTNFFVFLSEINMYAHSYTQNMTHIGNIKKINKWVSMILVLD